MKVSFPQIHDWIVRGHGGRARGALESVSIRTLPRRDRPVFASLAWRSGLPELGLRALHALVRPSQRRPVAASPAEKAEYGHCLVKYGAVEEGRALLAEVEPHSYPDVLFYRTSPLVAHWDYASSIPLLWQYLKTPQLDPYKRLVAEVNLAAAFVHEGEIRRATPLLRQLLYTSSLRGYRLMLGRVLELTGEALLTSRNWKGARRFLAEASERLKDTASVDAFIAQKFSAFVAFASSAGQAGSAELGAVRAEAIRREHWETVRDCDRLQALHQKDPESLRRIYHGTPFPHYRARLLEESGLKPEDLGSDYRWFPAGRTKKQDPAPSLDLIDLTFRGKTLELKRDSLVHRLLLALSEDFYRPLRLAAVFNKVHPTLHFNPLTSPPSIYDAMTRCRAWAASHRLPLRIAEKGGFYWLETDPGVCLRVPGAHREPGVGMKILALRRAFPDHEFGIEEAAGFFATSTRTALRFVGEAVRSGTLRRVGKGRATRYRFSGGG